MIREEGERARSQQPPDAKLRLMGGRDKFCPVRLSSLNFPLWLFHLGGLGLWAEIIGGDPAMGRSENVMGGWAYPTPNTSSGTMSGGIHDLQWDLMI